MTEANYERILPCGGKLKIFDYDWEIFYYFSGPSSRHKGTIARIPGVTIKQYISAYEDNFLEYEALKKVIPTGEDFSKIGKMGMSIRIGKLREGVCLSGIQMPISTKDQLNKLLDGYRNAEKQVIEFQKSFSLAGSQTSSLTLAPTLKSAQQALEQSSSLQERRKLFQSDDVLSTVRFAAYADAEEKKSSFDPYGPQRRMRGRKSHLAAAINQNIHDNPVMRYVWVVIFWVLMLGCFILAILK